MGKGKNWTREEDDVLRELWGTISADSCAKRLGRTRDAIIVRVARLGLGSHLENSARISFNALIKELGHLGGYSGVLKKFTDAGLKIHKQKVKDCSFRMVDIDEFWDFANKNRHLVDFSRMQLNALGAEPDWVKAKRTEDFNRKCAIKPHNAKWTEVEDKELLRLLRQYRYTYPEISERLHRTEGAIQRRVNDLGIKERPLKADNHTLWTEDQIQTMCQMIKRGCDYQNISVAIGKSTKAIRGKVFTAYLTESLAKVSQMIGDGDWGCNRPERRLNQKNLMTVEEKSEVKTQMAQLVGLLTYRLRKHFEDQDNWQRNLCANWDDTKGCTAGETDCDCCRNFQRIRPQYCVRCGATFYERKENRICERCRIQRKKQGYRKYMRMNQKEEEKNE